MGLYLHGDIGIGNGKDHGIRSHWDGRALGMGQEASDPPIADIVPTEG